MKKMDLSNIKIITNRLKMISTKEEYAQSMFQELTPDVTRYLSFDPPEKIQNTINFIQTSKIKNKNGEELEIVIVDILNGEFIGCAGIHGVNTKNPELGIWLKKSAHGKGYGREVISALIDWASKNLSYDYLAYPVAKDNIASRKLIESLGGILTASQLFISTSGKQFEEVEYRLS